MTDLVRAEAVRIMLHQHATRVAINLMLATMTPLQREAYHSSTVTAQRCRLDRFLRELPTDIDPNLNQVRGLALEWNKVW